MANYTVKSTDDLYFNYRSVIKIDNNYTLSTDKGFDMQWEFDSNDNGQPGSGWVTFYNIRQSMINHWGVKHNIAIYSGPPALFGEVGAGRINKVSQNVDGKDKSVTLNFGEYPVYNNVPDIKDTVTTTTSASSSSSDSSSDDSSSGSASASSTGSASSAPTTTTKQVNHTFPANVTARTIIKYISQRAKIRLGRVRLTKNNVYTRGYTLSSAPFQALQQIANDCNSKLYYRDDQLVIDNGVDSNPYHEHIFLSVGDGLTAQPTLSSKINKTPKQDQTTNQNTNIVAKQKQRQKQIIISVYTIEAWDDPRVSAGSYVRIQSKTLNNFCRVQSVKHQFNDDGYTMEMTVYA